MSIYLKSFINTRLAGYEYSMPFSEIISRIFSFKEAKENTGRLILAPFTAFRLLSRPSALCLIIVQLKLDFVDNSYKFN